MRWTKWNGRPAALAVVLAGLIFVAGCGSSRKLTLAPDFSPGSGTYTTTQIVFLSIASNDTVSIFYTLDGTTPTASSTPYTGPITVGQTETIKAIAVSSAGVPSTVSSATFTINLPTAATPVIAPAGGTFTSTQSATITDATTGSTIYYTLDGTTPTASSTKYTGPISVSKSQTINAIATAPNYNNSAVATAAFTISLPAATPVISPAGGTFTSAQSVTITDATSGATIYYTTDGSTPTTSSTKYTGPVTISQSGTLKAVATAASSSISAVASATFTINLPAATPAFSPAAGTYTTVQSVTITDATSGATIYYTTDGSTPTTSSAKYTGPISVAQSETINAIATATGSSTSAVGTAAYTINLAPAATPVFSPAAGTFASAQTVTITDATSGATIYYTVDGSTPTTSSAKYTGPISVAQSETVKAIATATGYSTSAVGTAAYTINLAPAATPVISPAGGTFASAQTVTITDTTPGASIYYTVDGSTPTTSSAKYTGPISVAQSETINAIATATGYNSSAVASASFTLNLAPAATPVISPAAGTYTSVQSVTITDTTPGASIYYTVDGSTPTTSSALYSGPITVSQNETINAIATASGYNSSTVATAAYTINLPSAATPVISPAGGTFTSVQSVTITSTTAGATIYYTTDGSTPTTSSTKYTGAFQVALPSETINAIAVATGYNNSSAATATFNIGVATYAPSFQYVQPLTTIPSPAPGGHVWYVDGVNGSDSNNGLSQTTAFKTIAKAYYPTNNLLFAGGDVVVIMPATYNEKIRICDNSTNGCGYVASVPLVSFGGTASNYTIFMGMPCNGVAPGQGSCPRPLIFGNTISMYAPYVRISGLEVAASTPAAPDDNDATNGYPVPGHLAPATCIYGSFPVTNTSKEAAYQDSNGVWRPYTHHLIVDNNATHDCSNGGIVFSNTDYVIAQGNTVYNNANWSVWDNSGISVSASIDYDSNTANYHAEIIDNIVYNNLLKRPAKNNCATGAPQCSVNGNGITFDKQSTTANLYVLSTYAGTSLVLGNVTFNNGGRGINVSAHNNVDIINNTSYYNGQPNAYTYQAGSDNTNPEIQVNANGGPSSNIHIYNNVLVPSNYPAPQSGFVYNPLFAYSALQPAIHIHSAANVAISNNLSSNTSYSPAGVNTNVPGTLDSTNILGVDPLFVNATTDPTQANFQLKGGSPALQVGAPLPFNVYDFLGRIFYSPANAASNPNGNAAPNMGAYMQ